jgi:hypothetical protein
VGYAGYRFPPEVVGHAIWSLLDVGRALVKGHGEDHGAGVTKPPLLRQEAAIDRQRMSGDHRRRGAREEGDRRRDIRRLGELP